MKVLVIGGGGREHALVWALAKSARVSEVVCAPGNGGIAQQARCVPVDVSDPDALLGVVEHEQPELTVVGPELPLSLGIVDELQRRGFKVFGPTQAAARLETSKTFAKEFMQRHGIPTAAYAVCTSLEQVREELKRFAPAVVVKADGLAAGKGVVICATHAEAEAAASEMFSGELLGSVQHELVLEEFLEGEELSFFALCDGKHAVAMAAAQDHKRIGEGDTGPNTGGMGAYSTDALMTGLVDGEPMRDWLTREVAQRTVDGMRAEGTPFVGILFCGIMMTERHGELHPMVLEFNARFGDPETQAILMRMETDVLELFEAGLNGTADWLEVKMRPGASVCVIVASGGYPGKYASGKVISGLEAAGSVPEAFVFHSGTAVKDGAMVTAGGRVLGVTAMSALGLQAALAKAYTMIGDISFEGMQFRRDIGWRALAKETV